LWDFVEVVNEYNSEAIVFVKEEDIFLSPLLYQLPEVSLNKRGQHSKGDEETSIQSKKNYEYSEALGNQFPHS
jgi:hypothetical protein